MSNPLSMFRLEDLARRAAWGGMLRRDEQLELVAEIRRLREENYELREAIRAAEDDGR